MTPFSAARSRRRGAGRGGTDAGHDVLVAAADEAEVDRLPLLQTPGERAVGESERHRHRYEFNNNYRAEFGAKGVSISTTSAVVISCVLVLVTDYVLTTFLL